MFNREYTLRRKTDREKFLCERHWAVSGPPYPPLTRELSTCCDKMHARMEPHVPDGPQPHPFSPCLGKLGY